MEDCASADQDLVDGAPDDAFVAAVRATAEHLATIHRWLRPGIASSMPAGRPNSRRHDA